MTDSCARVGRFAYGLLRAVEHLANGHDKASEFLISGFLDSHAGGL